jgi:mRNA-degrading endonuclease toxin of MazEF toxin-antitoxin module
MGEVSLRGSAGAVSSSGSSRRRASSRPTRARVVLLSRESAYRVRVVVTVAPVTRTIRNIPVEVALDESDGLPFRCVANSTSSSSWPRAT